MEKKRSFLGFLASLFVLFFTVSAFAAGYTCDDKKRYTSCNAGYYLNKNALGNACLQCSSADNRASQSCSRTCSVANGSCSVSGATQTCAGKFTGGSGGTTVGTSSCSGCSSWGTCSGGTETITCNAKFYLNNRACSSCATGTYSGQGETSCHQCSNKPAANSYYTGNAATNSCPWACNSGYHKNSAGTACEPDTKSVTCSAGYYIAKGATACSECPANKWCTGGTFTILSAGAAADTGITGSCPTNYTSPKKSSSYTACKTSCSSPCSGNNTTACASAYANVNTCTYNTSYTYTGGTKYCTNASCTTTSTCSVGGTCPPSGISTCRSCYTKNSGGTACVGTTYTITYKNGGGTGSDQTQQVQYKGTFTTKSSSTFIRGGYNFSSWGGDYPNASSPYTYNTCGNTTLTAQWTACSASNTAGACNCIASQHPTGSGCANCSVSCSSVSGFTLGTYDVCRSQTNSICYRNCTTADVDGSASVTGTVTKGGTSTCKANTCDANHCKTTVGTCITKPANGQCNTSGGDPITCNPGYHLNTAKTDCIANTYPVTYSCGGDFGTPPAKNTATYNASYTPRNNSCTRANYVFAGWQVSGTTDIKAAGANFQWKYTEAKTFTAKWTATACPAGQYLNAGNCNDCPVDWPLSQAGANHSRGDCYLTCNSATCIVPDEKQCPSGAYECDFNRDAQVAGREYFDTGECVLRPEYVTINSYCPIGTVKCDNGYYKKDATCPSCSSLGNGKWTQSLRSYNDSPAGCFAPCTKQCTQKPCPAHSTCTYESEAKSGGIFYPNDSCNVADFYCEMTITPDTGYENCTDSGCDPIVAEISLNHQSGTSTVSKIYQKYSVGYSLTNFGATVTKIAIPTRATYSFNGYFTAATGGEKIVDSDGTIRAANTKFTNKQGNTIYAQWTRLTRNCVAGKAYNGTTDVDCPAGKYCPGTGTAIIGTAGCATNCPSDAAGGSVTSATGSSAIDACKTVRPNTILADKTGRGDQTCGYNTSKSDYSTSCTIKVTACNAGYYRQAENSTTCSSTGIGEYSPTDDINKYSCSALNGAGTNVATATQNSGSATLCYNPCSNIEITNGIRVPVNTKEFYNGTTIPACTYTTTCEPGYRPGTSGTTAKCVWADPNACPEGFYCPDTSDEPIQCPNDKAGNEGSSELGSQNIEDCFITYNPYSEFQHGTGSAVCNYSTDSSDYTRCHDIEATSCNAGYYYRDSGASTCIEVVSGSYSPAGHIEATLCPAGGSGSLPFADSYSDCYKNCEISVPHSESVGAKEAQVFGNSESGYAACSFSVTCLPGYTVKGNNGENPTCDANTYTVTLDKNGGTGNVAASVECTFNSGACALPATTGLTRAGYSVGTKWCTDINGGGTCYNGGTTVTSNISANGTATTLYAVWTPNVYTITLKHADANVAGAPATAYLKYATGWFADSGAILPLSTMSTLPAKTGYEFSGYASANKTPIVSAEGIFSTTPEVLTFTTTNTEINVVWSVGTTICPAGQYYVGTGANCAPCSDNHYCLGGKYNTDAGKAGENACRDGGKTAPGSAASSESECFKEDLPTYVASYGSGTQKCYFNTDNLVYSENCTDKFITSCISGYWQSNKSPVQTAPDCEPVGTGYFSPDESTDREACPNGGTTSETDAASVQRCFKTGLDYSAAFGTGTQRCYYTSGTGSTALYTRECDTKKINKCRGGYWLDTAITNIDCSPVGYNYYSETDDIERHACEGGGKTNSDTTSSPLTCYKDSETYTAAHGGGFRTCYYTSGTGDNALYETSCETPTLTYCNGGYYANVTQNRTDCVEVGYGFWSPIPTPSHLAESLDRYTCGVGETTETSTSSSADECFICSGGQICPGDGSKPKTCSELTNGTHPNSDEGNTEVAGCWRDCEIADNAATMKGHDYYGKPSTCEIDHCKAGFDYNPTTRACEPCQAGMFCGGGDGDGSDNCPEGENCEGKKSCSELGDGSWTLSDIGAMGPKDCYKKCEQYDLEGGIAIPLEDRAYYAQQCQFKGFDPDGNPCDIESGTCITTSCKPSFEMVNGKCVACNRDHALSYKNTGNCMVETCEPGWHPYGQNCEGDITECDAPNALRAEKQWDYKKNAYGICLIKECEDGFHISSNACVRDIQECTVEHGTGEKEWNHTTGTWGECVATYCDPGWTNDPYETNEPTKQCGHCKNKFGVKGELAASSYSRGCTISACMYQGEMYNLENNECNPICDVNGYEDETGTMKWNPATKKCERTCKEGYVMW